MKPSRGAVACGHAGTAEAAVEVLRAGGNAVDAAIAAFFTACVYEPVLASLGGGGFAMCRMEGGDARLLDFFTHTPGTRRAASELDFERVTVDFGGATQDFYIGFGSVAVPGAVKGVFELHARFGTMPMSELAAPALEAIRRRPSLCELQARILEVVEPIYVARPSARAMFESPSKPGRALQRGDPLRFDELGAFIDVLVNEGESLFYRGEVAALIESQCRAGGGALSREDMRGYEANWRRPLVSDFRDARISLNPPPSAGGVLIMFGLELLKSRPALADDATFYHELAGVLALTDDAWLKTVDAERPWPLAEELLEPGFVQGYADELKGLARAWRGTTHLGIVDGRGNMVGMTVTNGEGCGEVTPGTGIMFNNMLGEENLNPAGFHQWPVASRMSSMMAPTLIEWPSGRRAMLGSGGSNRIRSAIAQVVVQLVDRRADALAATLAPRIHVENEAISIEGGIEEPLRSRLAERFHEHAMFDGLNFFFGGVHTVEFERGATRGAGDPRRAGEFRQA